MHKITMLGTGLIAEAYAKALLGQRRCESIRVVYSRQEARAAAFAARWQVPEATCDLKAAVNHPETDVVVVALPNSLHLEAVRLASSAGKAVLCTKPLGRSAAEAKEMLGHAEKSGVFHGYLEDLCYAPITLNAVAAARAGALGDIFWVRCREAHGGPHSPWFYDNELSGGGALLDLGSHCIEIARSYIGKDVRPTEVICHADIHDPARELEQQAVCLLKFADGALGQFEVSWRACGGLDMRDEVTGSKGTVFNNHTLNTRSQLFTAEAYGGYIAEKADAESGWQFPVPDEREAFGNAEMFADMLTAMDEARQPKEDFYDGYIVNAILDAAYRSIVTKRWERIGLSVWRGRA